MSLTGHKSQLQVTGLYCLALKRLINIEKGRKIIPFPEVFSELCRGFSMDKALCWEILFIFRDLNFIQIVAGHGIIINKTPKN